MKKQLLIAILSAFSICVLGQEAKDIFVENFETGANDWAEGDFQTSRRSIQNGKLRMQAIGNSKFTWCGHHVMPEKKQDFRVEAELTFVKYKNGEAGIMWGGTGEKDKLYFFLLTPNGAWNYGEWSPNFNSLTGSRKTPLINKDLASNKLKIERIGSKLKLYVNDAEVHSTKFPSIKGDYIGLVSGNGTHTVDVDYFIVSSLPPAN